MRDGFHGETAYARPDPYGRERSPSALTELAVAGGAGAAPSPGFLTRMAILAAGAPLSALMRGDAVMRTIAPSTPRPGARAGETASSAIVVTSSGVASVHMASARRATIEPMMRIPEGGRGRGESGSPDL